MGIVEAFTNIIVHEEEKEEGNWLQRNSLLIMIILTILVLYTQK